MTALRLLLPFACLAILAGCEFPKTTADASAKVDAFKSTMTNVGDKTQATMEASKPVFTRIGEVTESGVDTTKSTMEVVGTVTERGVNATKNGLESIGNTVIEIRDGKAPAQTAQAEQPAQ